MIAIICFTEKGKNLADAVSKKFSEQKIECSVSSAKHGNSGECTKTDEWVAEHFKKGNMLLFIGACGIAVRSIAPFVKDKTSDPAVALMDEGANFAVALLSGHLGGANDFVHMLSEFTGATPVITTATDVNGLFSVDSFSKENSLAISDMTLAKKFSAELLKKKQSTLVFPSSISECVKINGTVPKEIVVSTSCEVRKEFPRVHVSPFKNEWQEGELSLIPRCLVLGVGCRKGVFAQELKDFICRELDTLSADIRSVDSVCSIDLKCNEPALLSFCHEFSLPAHFFSASELRAVSGTFSSSPFVEDVTGVDNICERSVFAFGAKKLILPKTKFRGMTLAVGCMEIPVHFRARTACREQ